MQLTSQNVSLPLIFICQHRFPDLIFLCLCQGHSRPAVVPPLSPVTLVEVTRGKCNSLWKTRGLTQICFLLGRNLPSLLGLGLAAVMQDEAGAFSPVANYPFTLLNGNSLALFCQRFMKSVAAFLREVRGGKFPPINILYESHRRRLCWAQRGNRTTTGPRLGAQRGAKVLYEPVLKVPGQGCAGLSCSLRLVGLPACTLSSAFAYGQDGGAPRGAPTLGCRLGGLPGCRRCLCPALPCPLLLEMLCSDCHGFLMKRHPFYRFFFSLSTF